jgi:hypothetical protein
VAERPESAPLVRVHIGRIEVRAVEPKPKPAAARKPAPPRPGLSLDDYLKRRKGGGS